MYLSSCVVLCVDRGLLILFPGIYGYGVVTVACYGWFRFSLLVSVCLWRFRCVPVWLWLSVGCSLFCLLANCVRLVVSECSCSFAQVCFNLFPVG